MPSPGQIGAAPYSGGRGAKKPTPRSVCEMLVRKSRLRAELQMEMERIAEALPSLNPLEIAELKDLVAVEISTIDDEARGQIEHEAMIAASTRAMNVQLDRTASQALQVEMMRRLESGSYCPPPATLISEALALAFREDRHV